MILIIIMGRVWSVCMIRRRWIRGIMIWMRTSLRFIDQGRGGRGDGCDWWRDKREREDIALEQVPGEKRLKQPRIKKELIVDRGYVRIQKNNRLTTSHHHPRLCNAHPPTPRLSEKSSTQKPELETSATASISPQLASAPFSPLPTSSTKPPRLASAPSTSPPPSSFGLLRRPSIPHSSNSSSFPENSYQA